MLSEIVALLKFVFDAVKDRRVLSGIVPGRGSKAVVQLYLALDSVIDGSQHFLELVRKAAHDGEVFGWMAWPKYWRDAEAACLEIEQGTTHVLKRLQILRRQLEIYLPELPQLIEVRLETKMIIIKAFLDQCEPNGDVADRFAQKMREAIDSMGGLVGDELRVQDLPRGNKEIDVTTRSWSPGQIHLYARYTDSMPKHFYNAARIGEMNVKQLEDIRDELREFIKSRIDIEEVFFA